MDEKGRLDTLEVALNNEMREREFYLKHAERTRESRRQSHVPTDRR